MTESVSETSRPSLSVGPTSDTAGPGLVNFDVIFGHVDGYDGLIRKAQRASAAFQQVLDHPAAPELLGHPAMQPLLDEAGD